MGSWVTGFSVYSIIAGTMAQILRTNYNNFYYCAIDAINNVRLTLIDNVGFFGQVIYVFGMYLATLLLALLGYGFIRLIYFILGKSKKHFSKGVPQDKELNNGKMA